MSTYPEAEEPSTAKDKAARPENVAPSWRKPSIGPPTPRRSASRGAGMTLSSGSDASSSLGIAQDLDRRQPFTAISLAVAPLPVRIFLPSRLSCVPVPRTGWSARNPGPRLPRAIRPPAPEEHMRSGRRTALTAPFPFFRRRYSSVRFSGCRDPRHFPFMGLYGARCSVRRIATRN